MTGEMPWAGSTCMAASSTLKAAAGVSGSGICFTQTMTSIGSSLTGQKSSKRSRADGNQVARPIPHCVAATVVGQSDGIQNDALRPAHHSAACGSTFVRSAEQPIEFGVHVAEPVDHVFSQPINLRIESVDATVQPVLDSVNALAQALLYSADAAMEGVEFWSEGVNECIGNATLAASLRTRQPRAGSLRNLARGGFGFR